MKNKKIKYSTSKNPRNKGLFAKKNVFILLIASLFLIGGGAYALSKENQAKDSQVAAPTADQSPTNSAPADGDAPLSNDEVVSIKEGTTRPTSQNPSTESVIISELTQDAMSKQVVVKTELYGQNWTRCELSFTKGTDTIRKTADAIYQSSFSSCLGFAVSANEFPSSGEWSATLKGIKSDDTFVISTTEKINITK